MKMLKNTQWIVLASAILLQGVVLACAGSETMHGTMNAEKNTAIRKAGTTDSKMNDSKMTDTGMNTSKMGGSKMTDAGMNTSKMNDSKMTDTGMNTSKMGGSKMTDAGMNTSKMQEASMQDTTMKAGRMTDGKMVPAITAMLSGSKGHHAAGRVYFSTEMGKPILVLSDINIEKVPDGHVYLARNGDRAAGIDLGVLRQFGGTVSFALPAGTKPEQYDSVIIYCKRYHVEIGRARLGKQM